MNWRDELRRSGHYGNYAYIGILEYFDQNPDSWLSTGDMGRLGIKHLLKRKREYVLFNQATLERRARELRDMGFLKSVSRGGYVYYSRSPETASQTMIKPEVALVGMWSEKDPLTGQEIALHEIYE